MEQNIEQIDKLIHRMYRLFSISNSAMEKDELGFKLKQLMIKRNTLAQTS